MTAFLLTFNLVGTFVFAIEGTAAEVLRRIDLLALLLTLDLLGTFVFALSGATAGVIHRLDLFGVLVLSFISSTAGGITRDVLLGAVPPQAISDWRYFGVSLLAGLIAFFFSPRIVRLRSAVLMFDGAGLALFAVSGTQKALAYGLHPVMAALLGMLTGIGGGVARDLLINEVPTVLRTDLYAVAALAGAIVIVIGRMFNFAPDATAVIGAALCFGIRLCAIYYKWQFPKARPFSQSKGGAEKLEDNQD
ncbi:trimeric intracellular cation channel family protein [Pseudanabaenaceae cyanobacterium LEGE 13415]|nr:trimeric intracellular cation channel family protein [Pseudanabaenaceae cyanobacterium LEGE 13415]